jgi:hypothetical protein
MISGLMSKPIHRVARDLHLYFGLFVSPFVAVFACSVFFLVHAWIPGVAAARDTRVATNLTLEPGLEQLSGRVLIDALRPTLEAVGLHGEIGWVQHSGNPTRYVFPVSVPARITTVTIDVDKRQAAIEERTTGLADAVVMLHKSPGPHLVGMRMNWFFMRAWWWLSDATVYLLLFTTVSGIYLWLALRRDRKPGFVFAICGFLSLVSIFYALVS